MLKVALCYARRVRLLPAALYFTVQSSGEEVEADSLAADYSDETVLAMDRELVGVTGVVTVSLKTMQCGILEVKQLGVPGVSVFFRASEVILAGGQEQGGKLSALLPKGANVKLNGKLVKGDNQLQYLATALWVECEEANITHKVSQDIEPDLLDSYNNFTQNLDKRSSSEDSEEREEGTESGDIMSEASHKQDRQDHTYTSTLKEQNNNELANKKKKKQKRKLGQFNSEKDTVNYEIRFEAKISKTSLNTWKCRKCNLKFFSLVKVNMHANRDSCEVVKRKTRPYKDTKCADCGLKYPSRKELMLHREKAHPVKYECPTCPTKTFKRRRDWQRHSDTHRPEKRLACTMCPYSAYRPHRLRHHIQLHHAQPQVSHLNK